MNYLGDDTVLVVDKGSGTITAVPKKTMNAVVVGALVVAGFLWLIGQTKKGRR